MTDSNIKSTTNIIKDQLDKISENGNISEYTKVDGYQYIKEHPKYLALNQKI